MQCCQPSGTNKNSYSEHISRSPRKAKPKFCAEDRERQHKSSRKCCPPSTAQDNLERKLRNIKDMLSDVASNISSLRNRVKDTGQIIKQSLPEPKPDPLKELRDLIASIKQSSELNAEVSERGAQCLDMWESANNEGCPCRLNSASCNKLKKEIIKLEKERVAVDDKIRILKEAQIQEQRERDKAPKTKPYKIVETVNGPMLCKPCSRNMEEYY